MTNAKPLPPLTFLNECFRIVEDSRLFWREDRPLDHFSSDRYLRAWTTRFAGKEAGNIRKRDGYRVVRITHSGVERLISTHRFIWAIYHHEQPKLTLEIDHLDGDRLNNHIDNLRLVTPSDNRRNSKRWSNNTSGVTGVSWDKTHGKWKAYFRIGVKHKHLGYFDTIEEAAAVRKAASIENGFTDRHGEEA